MKSVTTRTGGVKNRTTEKKTLTRRAGGRKTAAQLIREALVKELEDYLIRKYPGVVKEKNMADWGIKRKFRYDYWIPEVNCIIEINGGTFFKSRHTFGEGYERDLMKLNLTSQIGLKIFQFTYPMLKRQEYKLFI